MTSVAERLRERVGREGAIPFAAFMAEALYGDGGYYRRAEWPVGARGDYVTGPALSPLLARATGRLLARLDRTLGATADFLEVGYGDGAHLAALALQGGADDPAAWWQPGGWLAAIGDDVAALLAAELDLRLQPVLGLIDALPTDEPTTCA